MLNMLNNSEEFVALNKLFKNEARDFTPWLSKNLWLIQDILDKESTVELYKREAKVQNLYLDLLVKQHTSNGNKLVIVENQYGVSDHDHFGKCLLYSYMIHPEATIWIAEDFLPEHRRVLQETNINLYLCKLVIIKETNHYCLHVYSESKSSFKHLIYHLEKDGENLKRREDIH